MKHPSLPSLIACPTIFSLLSSLTVTQNCPLTLLETKFLKILSVADTYFPSGTAYLFSEKIFTDHSMKPRLFQAQSSTLCAQVTALSSYRSQARVASAALTLTRTQYSILDSPLRKGMCQKQPLPKGSIVLLWSVLSLICGFYLLTLREGHNWGRGFSMYILHARNIAEGQAYADTGYIFNPDNPIAPRSYPLLLAPIYRLFGLNLEAMKVEIVLFFIAWLYIIFRVLEKELLFRERLALITLLGLNPYLWSFKDNILSEIPFVFFLYLALLLDALIEKHKPGIPLRVTTSFLLALVWNPQSRHCSVGVCNPPWSSGVKGTEALSCVGDAGLRHFCSCGMGDNRQWRRVHLPGSDQI